jgi:3-oxoadipate enol-lactonase
MKVRSNGIELNYAVAGKGPWLAMSHSLACDLSMWDAQADLLAERFTVLRFDTRGHGASEAPAGAYSLELLADDVQGLFDVLGIRQAHWVGLSMGGMIGQVFALKYPGVFKSIALCDTTSRYPPEAWAIWQSRIEAVEAHGMDAVVQGTLERWFTKPFRDRAPQTVAKVADMIRSTPAAGYIGCCNALPKINTTARLAEIRCPAIIIVGDQDAGTPPEMSREIHGALPGSELAILKDASHLSNIEQPAAFNKVLSAVLARVA